MEAGHDRNRRRPPAGMASAWGALCRLSATDPWLWLARSSAPGGCAAKTEESGTFATRAAPTIGVVLLEGLPKLLDALGAGAAHHG